jgi:hypothetical protein
MPETPVTRKKKPRALLALAILLSAGGLAAFVYLFVLNFDVSTLFLSPVIIALYQVPATFVFWLYKRASRRLDGETRPADGDHKRR